MKKKVNEILGEIQDLNPEEYKQVLEQAKLMNPKVIQALEILEELTEDELMQVIQQVVMTSGEVCEHFGIASPTLQIWSGKGYIKPVKRGIWLNKTIERRKKESRQNASHTSSWAKGLADKRQAKEYLNKHTELKVEKVPHEDQYSIKEPNGDTRIISGTELIQLAIENGKDA